VFVVVWASLSALPASAAFIYAIPPATLTPLAVRAGNGRYIHANQATFSYGSWQDALSATLQLQGFTPENGWNSSPQNGIINLTDGGYYVNTYYVIAGWDTCGAEMRFTFDQGSASPPAGATAHWLQLIHTSEFNTFGYQIGQSPGWWSLDNGRRECTPGSFVGPYYDSNLGPPYSTTFHDIPNQYPAASTTYWTAWTIPAWDDWDATHTIYLGRPAVTWGFYDPTVPEPASIWCFSIVGAALVLVARRRRRRSPDLTRANSV